MRIHRLLASLLLTACLAACNGGSGLDLGNAPGNGNPPLANAKACADGVDNDMDGLADYPIDHGCSSAADDEASTNGPRTRYAMNNQCWAIKAAANGMYITRGNNGFAATAASIEQAEAFYMKPTALGKYLFYNTQRQVLTASGGGIAETASANAAGNAEWTVLGVGDTTNYPATPAYDVEPTPEQVQLWMSFADPQLTFTQFTIGSTPTGNALVVGDAGQLQVVASASNPAAAAFSFEPASGCKHYPEAQSNFVGVPFSGTQPNGNVLGHADVHVHIGATTFLGGAHWGQPFNKFGVEQALSSCAVRHGPNGLLDFTGNLYTQDLDGHATDGYPTFSAWPSRGSLTHEAIYWKWLERAWAAGLRVIVNDLVENETLCELQRTASGDPLKNCNGMDNAGRQAGTLYAMEDYIDAQYGGPGKGFFQIVQTPAAARAVIEDGKIAVVLGLEISNTFDCKLTYNPLRNTDPENETGAGLLGFDNSYACTMEEGKPNSILTQIQRIHGWGVRQVISVHEFDNAFGGNGIFNASILNVGNRENSGGIPSGDLSALTNLLSGDIDPTQIAELITNLPSVETPTGEFWTTFNCPKEDESPGFSGYLWDDAGGSVQDITLPGCIPMGQDGRAGGPTPCYPAGVRQCNARWMTPIGLYTYGKLMEMGFIIDFDHMAQGMKTELLELAEAQTIAYPIVSTHGSFGGITNNQASRLLRNGGYIYPANSSSRGFRKDMDETYGIWQQATAAMAEKPLFGFGYGTDTNGLSAQSAPRGDIADGDAVVYPFSFYDGSFFDSLPAFQNVRAVRFNQPTSTNNEGEVVRTWHEDIDGNAHYGMLAGFIEEIRLEGTPEQMLHLFNSAEVYLRTWNKTLAASQAIQANGLQMPQTTILRPAPIGDGYDADKHYK